MDASKPRIRGVPALSRAIAILRLLGNSAEPVSLRAIASSLSFVPSTCLHILRVLVVEGLVKMDEHTKRYTLDTGILSFARGAIERSGFATLVQPVLDRLAYSWEVTTAGVEVHNLEYLMVLAVSRSRLPFVLHMDVGYRFSSLVSASGRLVAAYGEHASSELKRRFKSLIWDKPMTFTAWQREVDLSRKRGFSVDRGQSYTGVTVVAVPLLNTVGRITHTLVGIGLSNQLDGHRIKSLAKDMGQEARRLSTLILRTA